jgi:universal stress protein E
MSEGTASFQSICYVRCGVPGDAIAFEKALLLAEKTGAQLDIVAVLEALPATVLQRLSAIEADTADLTGENELRAELESLVSQSKASGVNASSELLHGAAFDSIVEHVMHHRHDLLVKTPQSAQLIHQVFFGHLDRQLIRNCPCPVWIEHPAKWSRRGRILAAVDPSPYHQDRVNDPIREELNLAILETAVKISQAFGAQLHVLHVWPYTLESKLRGRLDLTDAAVTKYGEAIRADHEQAFTELISPYMSQIVGVRLIKGHAGEVIARLATEESVDVIVMGTTCRSGLSGVLIGNTAETVLDQVKCSVVALKPPGYSFSPR